MLSALSRLAVSLCALSVWACAGNDSNSGLPDDLETLLLTSADLEGDWTFTPGTEAMESSRPPTVSRPQAIEIASFNRVEPYADFAQILVQFDDDDVEDSFDELLAAEKAMTRNPVEAPTIGDRSAAFAFDNEETGRPSFNLFFLRAELVVVVHGYEMMLDELVTYARAADELITRHLSAED